MPRRPSSDPHLAWPLKLFAVGAVLVAVVTGYRTVVGGDSPPNAPEDERPRVERVGSEEVGDADRDWRFGTFPPQYRITTRVRLIGTESTEVLQVAAPFDSRAVTYRGATATGAPVEEREQSFGVLATRSGDQTSVLQIAPALAGPRPAAALLEAEEAGLVERREVREVAGHRCQVWRTGGALAAARFLAPTDDGYLELCVDERGLVLEEWQVDDGIPTRQRVATKVETAGLSPEDLARLPREATLTVDQGGGSIVAIAPAERPPGPFLDVAAPPDGFTLRGRFTVVPPQAALLPGAERGKAYAATTDVFVRGADAIFVEQGGVLDLSDPWSVDAAPDVDLGAAVGTGELVPGRGGGEVRALLGRGRYLRVAGSVATSELVDLARGLVPVEAGSGLRVGD